MDRSPIQPASVRWTILLAARDERERVVRGVGVEHALEDVHGGLRDVGVCVVGCRKDICVDESDSRIGASICCVCDPDYAPFSKRTAWV